VQLQHAEPTARGAASLLSPSRAVEREDSDVKVVYNAQPMIMVRDDLAVPARTLYSHGMRHLKAKLKHAKKILKQRKASHKSLPPSQMAKASKHLCRTAAHLMQMHSEKHKPKPPPTSDVSKNGEQNEVKNDVDKKTGTALAKSKKREGAPTNPVNRFVQRTLGKHSSHSGADDAHLAAFLARGFHLKSGGAVHIVSHH